MMQSHYRAVVEPSLDLEYSRKQKVVELRKVVELGKVVELRKVVELGKVVESRKVAEGSRRKVTEGGRVTVKYAQHKYNRRPLRRSKLSLERAKNQQARGA